MAARRQRRKRGSKNSVPLTQEGPKSACMQFIRGLTEQILLQLFSLSVPLQTRGLPCNLLLRPRTVTCKTMQKLERISRSKTIGVSCSKPILSFRDVNNVEKYLAKQNARLGSSTNLACKIFHTDGTGGLNTRITPLFHDLWLQGLSLRTLVERFDIESYSDFSAK